jgi:tRNA(Ile)-lysidine synthetase-like protein
MALPLSSCEAALAGLPERLLIAVSGGVDSVALLDALVATGRRPVVLHFNHRWRPESKEEAAFVRQLARHSGLKAVVGTMPAQAAPKREAAARAARYAFFAKTARRLGIPDLVLAHHADDQVETFLLQLLRGAGAAARGMDAETSRDGLVLHRPWLALWKKEITAYARRRRLAWREDASNQDTRHRRNQIRRRVLPYLRKTVTPHAAENLWRAAEILRAESEWLDSLCHEMATLPELPVATLRASPPAQQRRTILRWLQARGLHDISFADVEAVRGLLLERDPARINLSHGRFARRRAGRIFIT